MEINNQKEPERADPGRQVRGRLGLALEEIVAQRGDSIRGIARALGISQPGLHAILSGKTKAPSEATLLKIEQVLGVRREWVLTGSGDAFVQYPSECITEGGITFIRYDFGRVFKATIEGWRRILNFEIERGPKYRNRQNPWYEIAWDARDSANMKFPLRSISLDSGVQDPDQPVLFGLRPKLAVRYVVVLAWSHDMVFPRVGSTRTFPVANILQAYFSPHRLWPHSLERAYPFLSGRGIPPCGVVLPERELAAIKRGPYPKSP